jgi:type I restriction enzyme M protein
MEELAEEHSGEDGLLEEAKTDKGKLTKASVKARLSAIKHDWDAKEERTILNGYFKLIEKESAVSKAIKDAQRMLDKKVTAQYSKLSEGEIKILIIEDKWMATLDTNIHTELDRISQALTGRIKQLAERYAQPLPELTDKIELLGEKVDEHLKKMGFAWN